MATHSSILAWRILWTEDPGGLWPMGSQRVGHDWATDTAATIPPQRSAFSLLRHHCATSSSLQGALEQPVTTRGRRTAARLPWQGAAFRDRRSQRQGFSSLPTLCWPSAQAAVLRSPRGSYLRQPGNQRTHRSIKSRVYYFLPNSPIHVPANGWRVDYTPLRLLVKTILTFYRKKKKVLFLKNKVPRHLETDEKLSHVECSVLSSSVYSNAASSVRRPPLQLHDSPSSLSWYLLIT